MKTQEDIKQISGGATPDPAKNYPPGDREAWVQYFGNWVWRAVECLVELEDFQPSAKWVASRLNISLEEAVDALEGLEKLKLLRRNSTGRLVRTALYRHASEFDLNEEQLLKQHLLLSTQISSKTKSLSDSRFEDLIIGSEVQLIGDFFKRVEEALEELVSRSKKSEANEVFGLSLSCNRLTAPLGSKEGAQQ